jgi:hypothetical protein
LRAKQRDDQRRSNAKALAERPREKEKGGDLSIAAPA